MPDGLTGGTVPMDAVAPGFALSPSTARAYLEARGWLPPGAACQVTPLGGGVSNEVLLVEGPAGRMVLKQALPRLRVAAEWRADPRRAETEARCLDALRAILPEGAVPDVVFTDPDLHVLAMTAAPAAAVNLKQELLAGRVPYPALLAAGRLLGRIQSRTRPRADLARAFADLRAFRELRLEPYHGAAARRHPDLAPALSAAAAALARQHHCLVHGDFSPKNLLVADGRLVLLDCEVAHWGHRAFDPAFLLHHLALKSVHLPARAPALAAAALQCWSAYLEEAGWAEPAAVEAEVLPQLGCLLLARVDGKSPAEYLVEEAEKDRVRRLARALLTGRLSRVADVFEAVVAGG